MSIHKYAKCNDVIFPRIVKTLNIRREFHLFSTKSLVNAKNSRHLQIIFQEYADGRRKAYFLIKCTLRDKTDCVISVLTVEFLWQYVFDLHQAVYTVNPGSDILHNVTPT